MAFGPQQFGLGDAEVGRRVGEALSRVGLAGSFEMVDKDGLTLDPSIKLSDVQAQEITLASAELHVIYARS